MINEKIITRLKLWAIEKTFALIVLNIYLISLVLLRSAGYFEPYLTISINFVYLSSLIIAVALLGLRSKGSFIISIIFWILSCLLVLLDIHVWAERTAVYTYEALLVGVLLFCFEYFSNKNN